MEKYRDKSLEYVIKRFSEAILQISGCTFGVSGGVASGKSTLIERIIALTSLHMPLIPTYYLKEQFVDEILNDAINSPERNASYFQLQQLSHAMMNAIAAKAFNDGVKAACDSFIKHISANFNIEQLNDSIGYITQCTSEAVKNSSIIFGERLCEENLVFFFANYIYKCKCKTDNIDCHHINYDFMKSKYMTTYRHFNSQVVEPRYLFLYVKMNKLYERRRFRNRKSEEGYLTNYDQKLYWIYFQWVLGLYQKNKIIVIDWNNDQESDHEFMADICTMVDMIVDVTASGSIKRFEQKKKYTFDWDKLNVHISETMTEYPRFSEGLRIMEEVYEVMLSNTIIEECGNAPKQYYDLLDFSKMYK